MTLKRSNKSDQTLVQHSLTTLQEFGRSSNFAFTLAYRASTHVKILSIQQQPIYSSSLIILFVVATRSIQSKAVTRDTDKGFPRRRASAYWRHREAIHGRRATLSADLQVLVEQCVAAEKKKTLHTRRRNFSTSMPGFSKHARMTASLENGPLQAPKDFQVHLLAFAVVLITAS